MHHLLWRKIIALIVVYGYVIPSSSAQKTMWGQDGDEAAWTFGLSMGMQTSTASIQKSSVFLNSDSVLSVVPNTSYDIQLGLVATARLTNRLQIRWIPALNLGTSRIFSYTLTSTTGGGATQDEKNLPVASFELPMLLKFNSDRIDNFRCYINGGPYIIGDLSQNQLMDDKNPISVRKFNYGFQLGLGVSFYLPNVVVSPNLKFSYGLSNMIDIDPSFKYSAIFKQVVARSLCFSVILSE